MFLNFIMNLCTIIIMSFCVKLCELLYLPMGTHTHEIFLSIVECYCVFIVHLCKDIKIYRYKDIKVYRYIDMSVTIVFIVVFDVYIYEFVTYCIYE